jgi:16S rRNA (cytosine1402-N4)-methyltransferase
LLGIIRKASRDANSPRRVFQALRIAVNDEYRAFASGFTSVVGRLAKGGILMVIAFHSGEERLLKQLASSLLRPPTDETTGQYLYSPVLAKVGK